MLIKLIQKYQQFLRYCIVGGVGTIVDFSFLYILTEFLGIYYLLSATLAFTIAAISNYILNREWTFESSGKKRRELPIFMAISVIGLGLNNSILYSLVEYFGLWYIWSKVLATVIVLFWNFFANKHITFKKYE